MTTEIPWETWARVWRGQRIWLLRSKDPAHTHLVGSMGTVISVPRDQWRLRVEFGTEETELVPGRDEWSLARSARR